jgi:hypothetical protein
LPEGFAVAFALFTFPGFTFLAGSFEEDALGAG